MTASGFSLASSARRSATSRSAAGWADPRTRRTVGLVGFAVLIYVPMLVMHAGRVVADTKSYPYLDPSRFIGRVGSLWDPNIGMGTVTHQNVGYLFPLAPFYWVTENVLGLPAWAAQRLWLGTLLFAAGLGVRYLLKTLDVRGPGVPVAMLVYALTPYATEFSARLSVLLGPWAALGFLLGFTIRALRDPRGWKYPALIALTIQVVGSVNATALLYPLIAPALWVPYAVWVQRELTWREAWSVIWRTALLTVLTSLWWAAGLLIEGSYGMGILRFTESVGVVSHTSTATEVLRGLGYWFFYGGDLRGPWNDAVLDFTRRVWLIPISFSIPLVAMVAAGFTRWKHRAYFISLILLGTVIAVAASPYEHPSILGSLFKTFATSSTAGFALRSTARAVPMLVLGLAVLIGVGLSAFWERANASGKGWVAITAAVVVGFLAIANAPGLWNGRYYSRYLERPEQVPKYWRDALHALDAKGSSTRVLALPGADFAAYRWGDTIDPIEPGLMDRPYVARELVPWGGEATTNLLIALDRRVQDRLLDPNALAPIARLMGVGDVLLRLDLVTDQFSLVPARDLWQDFTKSGVPPGLGQPVTFGTRIPGRLLGTDFGDPSEPRRPDPKPVAVFPVKDPAPITRAQPAAGAVVLDGDGEGLVDAAGVGLLPASRVVVPSPEYAGTKGALARHVPADAVLVVTDTNRRQGMRWAGMRNNYGYTEQAGERPLVSDLLDQRLPIYPHPTDRARTVTELRGLKSVRATTYGTPAFGYTPDARPANAFDGDLDTAWEVAAGETTVGHERIVAELERPVTTGHIDLVPASKGPRGRWITRVGVRLDGGRQIVRPIARRGPTRISFPRRRFHTVEVQILGTDQNRVAAVATEAGRRRKSSVGFAEIRVGDDAAGSKPVRVQEVTRMPVDLLGTLGARSATHPLAVLMTSPGSGVWRRFVLPTARDFSLTGTAFLNTGARDDAVDLALGIPGLGSGGIRATSSERLANVKARASNAFDGDTATAWNSRSRDLVGEWIQVETERPVTVDHLDLSLLADGRHSMPTRVTVTADGGTPRTVDVPAAGVVGGIESPTIAFPAITGSRIRVTIDAVAPVRIRGSNGAPITLPVGIAELGIAGVRRAPLPAAMPTGCLDHLVRVDGEYRGVRVTGSTRDAIEGRPLPMQACDGAPLTLAAGSHEVRARSPKTAGLSLTQLLLLSDRSGHAADATAFRADLAATPRGNTPPSVKVLRQGRSSSDVQFRGATRPFWLVLGQSHNRGWQATIDGHDLGAPQLVNGYANGWLIDPARYGSHGTVALVWTPQRGVWIALTISALAVLACVGILLVGARRRRRRRVVESPDPAADGSDDPLAGLAGGAVVVSPFRREGVVVPWRRAVIFAVLVGGAAIAIVGLPWGLVTGSVALAAARSGRARGSLRLLPAVIVAFVGVYVSWGQFRHSYPPAFDWPLFFDRVRNLSWLAVVLLVVDALVGWMRREPNGPTEGVTPSA